MWILMLNDMRCPKSETLEPVVRADTHAELVALVQRERVDVYIDGRFHKSFRQGGPLEWFNPPWSSAESFVEIDVEARVRDYAASLARQINEIPHVGYDVTGSDATPTITELNA